MQHRHNSDRISEEVLRCLSIAVIGGLRSGTEVRSHAALCIFLRRSLARRPALCRFVCSFGGAFRHQVGACQRDAVVFLCGFGRSLFLWQIRMADSHGGIDFLAILFLVPEGFGGLLFGFCSNVWCVFLGTWQGVVALWESMTMRSTRRVLEIDICIAIRLIN